MNTKQQVEIKGQLENEIKEIRAMFKEGGLGAEEREALRDDLGSLLGRLQEINFNIQWDKEHSR